MTTESTDAAKAAEAMRKLREEWERLYRGALAVESQGGKVTGHVMRQKLQQLGWMMAQVEKRLPMDKGAENG